MKKKIVLLALAAALLLPGLNVFAATTATSYFSLEKGVEYYVGPEIEVGDTVEFRYTVQYSGIAYGSIWMNNRQLPYATTKNAVTVTTIQANDIAYDSRLTARKYLGNPELFLRNVIINGEEVYNADTSPTPSIRPYEKTGVTDLAYTATETTAQVTWVNPTIWQAGTTKGYLNGDYMGLPDNGSTGSSYTLTNLQPNTSYPVELRTAYQDGTTVNKTITVTTDGPQPPGPAENLTATAEETSILLAWENPTSETFQQIHIYRDGVKIGESTTGSYFDENLTPDTTYQYVLKSVDITGLETAEASISQTTLQLEPIGEVSNLEVVAEHDKVNLSWNLPDTDRLQHVNIYRDEITEVSVIDQVFGVPVHAASTEIFETNGTYFNDLTVEPETEYEYTVTTTDTAGVESVGVTAVTGTPEAPPIDLSGVEFPFTANDFLRATLGLIGVIGLLILIVLAFKMAKKWIKLINRSIQDKRNGKAETSRVGRDFSEGQQARERERLQKTDRSTINPAAAEKLTKERFSRQPAERPSRQSIERTSRTAKELPVRPVRTIDRQPREPRRERGAR